jgi:beta-glucanase (GH16 family)
MVLLLLGIVCDPAPPAGTRRAAIANDAGPGGHWRYLWGDEFDGRRINVGHWNVTNTLGRPNYEGELNCYDPNEVDVADGQLLLRTRPRPRPRHAMAPYLSGRVTTKGKFAFLYGKVEIRAKLPGSPGVWPAIWMLPADGSWPPEVDIVELLGAEPRRIYMNNHYGSARRHRQDQDSYRGPADFTAGYHTFTLEWRPGQLRWLVDGVERKVTDQNVPDRAMYLLINTAVGGDWGGPPTAQSRFPQTFLVDYVRVFQFRKG